MSDDAVTVPRVPIWLPLLVRVSVPALAANVPATTSDALCVTAPVVSRSSVVTLALNGLVIEIAEAIGVGVLLPGRVMAPTRKVVAVICARLAGEVPPEPSTIAPLFGASSTVGAE